jgi:uncharacterized protein (TIGR03437 family)
LYKLSKLSDSRKVSITLSESHCPPNQLEYNSTGHSKLISQSSSPQANPPVGKLTGGSAIFTDPRDQNNGLHIHSSGEIMQQLIFRLFCISAVLGVIAMGIGCNGMQLRVRNDTVSTNTRLVLLAGGLTSPLYVTNARDGSGRLFILERPGRIRVIRRGESLPIETPFLDISAKVLLGGERGLLRLAFHPQYRINRRFFVNYTRVPDGATIISEFKVSESNPNIAETDERVLLTIAQPFSNHNGGMIEFGPDGYFYIGMGDGGSSFDPNNRAQNIEDLLGKMLRIDVDTMTGTAPYSSPPDNPFFGITPGRDEIYALGLRNPFRWSFDRSTGELYAGDVGQNAIEEIDIIRRGGNYGWRVFEGTTCTNLDLCDRSRFAAPIHEYDHSNERCSVTGGYVYRGSRGTFPAGSYLFGDFCTGEIFIRRNNSVDLLLDTDMLLASFGEDEDGELYVADLRGSVFRLATPGVASTVSAASFLGSSIAPGSLAVGLGSGFTNSKETISQVQGATMLGGAFVSLIDRSGNFHRAKIFQVSPTQIYHEIPATTGMGKATIVYGSKLTGEVSTSHIELSPISPGLMSADGSGTWVANASVTRLSLIRPSTIEPVFENVRGDIVPLPIDVMSDKELVFLNITGTGFRSISNLSKVEVTIGGTPVPVIFAGAQGTGPVQDRLVVILPQKLSGRGLVDLVMTVDGQKANTVKLRFK